MLTLTVGKNGEDYYTIQEAINAVPYEEKARIIISEGLYEEKIFSDKSDISLEGKGKVVIRWSDFAKEMMYFQKL